MPFLKVIPESQMPLWWNVTNLLPEEMPWIDCKNDG